MASDGSSTRAMCLVEGYGWYPVITLLLPSSSSGGSSSSSSSSSGEDLREPCLPWGSIIPCLCHRETYGTHPSTTTTTTTITMSSLGHPYPLSSAIYSLTDTSFLLLLFLLLLHHLLLPLASWMTGPTVHNDTAVLHTRCPLKHRILRGYSETLSLRTWLD